MCGAKTGKVDIFEVLENIATDFPTFKEQVKNYVPLKNAPVFNPFFAFYREWKNFVDQNPENPQEAQKKVAKQYMLVTLQEMKTRYAYHQDPTPGAINTLKKRLETIEKLRQQFFPEKPEIILDFSAEKDTINETLKKEIARYNK